MESSGTVLSDMKAKIIEEDVLLEALHKHAKGSEQLECLNNLVAVRETVVTFLVESIDPAKVKPGEFDILVNVLKRKYNRIMFVVTGL